VTRDEFPYVLEIQTRWADNDVYGHVNNVVYYSYFDTLINRYLIEQGGLDIALDHIIAVCVDRSARTSGRSPFPKRSTPGSASPSSQHQRALRGRGLPRGGPVRAGNVRARLRRPRHPQADADPAAIREALARLASERR